MTSTRLLPLALSLVVAGTTVASSRPARADEHSAADLAQARDLLNQGMDLRDKGNPSAALEKLRAAHALVRTPITGLELGRTYLLLGRLVEARESFLSVERIPVVAEETSRSATARTESAKLAAQLRPRIPSVTIKVTGVPVETLAVTVDGSVIPSEALPAPRFVNPGSHSIVATSTRGGHAETTVELREGESREVELKIAFSGAVAPAQPAPTPTQEPPAPALETPASESRNGWSPLLYAGAGLAAVGVVAGGVSGILAISKASSVKSNCVDTRCPPSSQSDLDSGLTLGNVSTISFAVAGAGVVLGVVGFLLSPHQSDASRSSASSTPWLTAGVGGLQGTF